MRTPSSSHVPGSQPYRAGDFIKVRLSPMHEITTYYRLGVSDGSYHDIYRFLEDGFEEIKKTHPLKDYILPSWPRSDDIGGLAAKAPGQFLHARIVLNYTGNAQLSVSLRSSLGYA
ncbi:hypothetical protein NLJ89_g7076 [Agrocybe chaxingu]|uniref:Uncharacterized protein n=1 Tax=Agrocybe chaxingu TaxID=84603 RepID=A0A9W8K4A1_9AGAR|nr:hypothetical protein NLJ89_g7076 [Agrocybe chaxingu]